MKQREIKFRVWDRLAKCWIYLSLEQPNELDILEEFVKEKKYLYVGLLDKKGKEIYEGDIVKADWGYGTHTEVEFEDFFYAIREYALDSGNLEVIGNIYENKDLLNN